MTLRRLYPLHNRLATFTANAEAFAALALQRPVMTASDLRFVEHGDGYGHRAQAAIDIDGVIVHGHSKPADSLFVVQHVYIGAIATLLGAPAASYMLVTDCRPHPGMEKYREMDTVPRLFSATPFDECETGSDFLRDIAFINHVSHVFDIRGESISLGAAGQFRAFINDTNWLPPNVVRDRQSQQWCLIDPKYAALGKPALLDHSNRDLIQYGRVNLPNEAERKRYDYGANQMSARIFVLPDQTMDAVAESMQAHGLPAAHELVARLKARRPIFNRTVVKKRFREFA